MNYPANTRGWVKGDIVIHDADAKREDMLMIVIGYTRGGLVKTQYVDRRHHRTIYRNALRYLHDPQLFGLSTARNPYTGPKPPTPEQFDAAKRADEAAQESEE